MENVIAVTEASLKDEQKQSAEGEAPQQIQEDTQAEETQEEPKEEKRRLLAGEYYIKEIEILGNNLVETNFVKDQV